MSLRGDEQGSGGELTAPNLLEHIKAGVFVIEAGGIIAAEISAHARSVLGDALAAGASVLDVLRIDVATQPLLHARFGFWLANIFGADDLQWLLAREQPPRELSMGESHLRLHYAPVYESGGVVRVVVTVDDITAERRLAKAAQDTERKHEAHLDLLAELSGLDADLFELFLQESSTLLADCDDALMHLRDAVGDCAPDIDAIFRVVHTLKGNARIFKISSMERAAHELEGALHAAREQTRGCSSEQLSAIENGLDSMHDLLGELAELGRHVLLGDRLATRGEKRARRKGASMQIDEARVLELRRRHRDLLEVLDSVGVASERLTETRDALEAAVEGLSRVPFADLYEACRKTHLDASRALRKPVDDLKVTGSELTIDSRLAAKLRNVLAHAIRNAIDHGIEASSVRRAKGKTTLGQVRLDASWEDEALVICVSDDGAGFNATRLKQSAFERLIIDDEQLRSMPDDEAVLLAFHPGVSTRPRVSPTSGRGVGMDAIRSGMKEVGGVVELASDEGRGTTLTLRIPDASRRYSDAAADESGGGESVRNAVAELQSELDDAKRERERLYRQMELSSNELMHANAELNAIFSALPDLFLRVDAQRMVVDHKGGGATARAHLVEVEPWNAPLETCVVADAVGPLERLLASPNHARVEYAIGHGNDARHFEARALALPNRDILVAIEDVSERVRAHHALLREQDERAQELRSFAAAASHDLRAPLRNIDVLAEFAIEDMEEPDEAKRHLRLLRSRVQRMEALLTGVLEYVQVGVQDVRLHRVDVGVLVREVVDLVVPAGFETTIATAWPRLLTSRTLLERVLLNLLSNAVKHHDCDTGLLTISHFDDGDFLVIHVSDDGPGIAERDRARAFGMFKRLARTAEGGAGMGLPLIRRILQRVGGNIELDHNHPRGTVAVVRWPNKWPGRVGLSSKPPPRPH